MATNNIQPLEAFDWDAFENDGLVEADKEATLAAYEKTLSNVSDNEVVEGEVTDINDRMVTVNIGYKSEGVIPRSEFRYNADLAVGDKVEVYIERQEDKNGQLALSHKKAREARSWERVNAAKDGDEVVTGYVKCRTKGGMIVDVLGMEAFLPGSQIDVKPIHDYDIYVGKTMEFKIVKINQEFRNVVVSHKALVTAELEKQKLEIISKLEKGQVLEGTVKNVAQFGVFIDLGGVDGLVHITDLSWGRVAKPEKVEKNGQEIQIIDLDINGEKKRIEPGLSLNVVILDFDDERKRIALGLKQLLPHPWDSLDANLKEGDVVHGKVLMITDYGAFVEVAPGVEGLIHVSEMSWSAHLHSASDFVKVGDELDCAIISLDRQNRKMSLGLKQLKADPWETIEERFPVGSKHTAKVRNFTNFGIFVEIEEGVDGLVHISDLSWTKKVRHPSEFTKVGASLEVQVLDIDKDNRRLSLGHKQLEDNPWENLETIFTHDSVHHGKIIEVLDKGSVVALDYGVEGFATPKHLVKADGTQAQLGEELDFKVIEFNKDSHRIILSHSRIHEDKARAEAREARKSAAAKKSAPAKEKEPAPAIQNKAASTTLGDLDALAALKASLESQE